MIVLDFMTALLHAYENAEKMGLVDNQDSNSTLLLPLYHTNLKSNGMNIIHASLSKDGTLIKAYFVPNGEFIVFPVTQDSIARSGKNPPSHPLVDKISYLSPLGGELHTLYKNTFRQWLAYDNPEQVQQFLETIQNFLVKKDMLQELTSAIFGKTLVSVDDFVINFKELSDKGKQSDKKVDLSSVFLTFSVEEFIGYKNMSITEYKALHQAYIDYVESLDLPRGICNISGEEQQLTTKHRGLMGNAKLISVSNNIETYKGRFSSGEDIIKIGYRTSEKIHLMLKYLLENTNSHKWLGGQQNLINWFSDDIENKTNLDFTSPFGIDFDEQESEQAVVSIANKVISDSFIRGEVAFSNSSKYYIAIVDKASNGRISLKFFRELESSKLLDNLEFWQTSNQWEYYDQQYSKMRLRVPSMRQMIAAAYGIERNGMLEVDNDNFQKDQFQKLVISLIDGQRVPANITKSLESNVKNRLHYQKTWKQLLFVTLGLLHNRNGEELKPMLDKQNMNRSYLFGRLLAIFDRLESAAFNKNDDKRVTNAQKFWTSYTNHPASTMQILLEKTKYYERTLMQSKPGLKVKLEKEKEEVINAISTNYLDSKELNRSLDYHFIFGYYAEEKFIYSKTINESEE